MIQKIMFFEKDVFHLWLPGGRGGSGRDWALGVSRCTPLEWISNGILRVALGTTSGHLRWSDDHVGEKNVYMSV